MTAAHYAPHVALCTALGAAAALLIQCGHHTPARPTTGHTTRRHRRTRMIRENRFLISRKPFAIDLSTVTGTQHPRGDRHAFSGTATAVWYRRKQGATRASIGTLDLWQHYLPEPLNLDDPHAILSADLDGRYGGDCHGRWDGERYWGSEKPESMEAHLAVLRPMLADYPTIPAGFDGWWTYQEPTR